MLKSGSFIFLSVLLVIVYLLLLELPDALRLLESPGQDLNLFVEVLGDNHLVVQSKACGFQSLYFDVLVLGTDVLAIQLLDYLDLRQCQV